MTLHFYESQVQVIRPLGSLSELSIDPDEFTNTSVAVRRHPKSPATYFLRYLERDGASAAFRVHRVMQQDMGFGSTEYVVVDTALVYENGRHGEVRAKLDLPRGRNPEAGKPKREKAPETGDMFSAQDYARCYK